MKTKEKPSDSPRLKPPGAVNGGQTGGSDIDSGVLDVMGVGCWGYHGRGQEKIYSTAPKTYYKYQ